MSDLYKRWLADTFMGISATDEQTALARSIFEVIEASRCMDQSKNPLTSDCSSQTTDAPGAATSGLIATRVSPTHVSVSSEALDSHLKKNGSHSLDFGNGVILYITLAASGAYHFNLDMGGKSQN